MHPRLIALIAVLALLVVAPPLARATTVRALPERLEIVGQPGELNRLTLRHDVIQEVVRVQDVRPIAALSGAGRPCTRLGPSSLECPYPPADSIPNFVIDLGDRDDRLLIDAQRLSPEFYNGVFSQVRDGPGNDTATSVPGATFVAGPGNDVLRGAERATPSGGNDTIFGSVGPDTLDGGAGADVIRGGLGADVVRGGTGNDRLFGESGQDRLFGGIGNDFLRGGTARDLLSGGPGRDVEIQG